MKKPTKKKKTQPHNTPQPARGFITIQLNRNGKVHKVFDLDGEEASPDPFGPGEDGGLKDPKLMMYSEADTPEADSQCWFQHAGTWYRVC